MALSLTKDTGRLVSGIVLILCGLGQATQLINFSLGMTLVVAGFLFISEALHW